VTATLLDGKALARKLQSELTAEVAEFIENNSVSPTLAVVLVGENPASEVYVRNKRAACERVGIESRLVRLPADTSQEELLKQLSKLNKDEDVHGILVQLPLPPQIEVAKIVQAVSPAKDVDAFHPENVGRIVQGRPRFLPCTPQGVRALLASAGIEPAGKHVVILGRSEIVGKPLALLLMQKGAGGDATVTVCHSRSQNLAEITRQADILVAAVGQPRLVTANMVKPGAAVVDVGTNQTPEGLVGDVDFAAVNEVAGFLSPVPGGVGPLTITMLLQNTLEAARQQQTS